MLNHKAHYGILAGVLVLLMVAFHFILPEPVFKDPFSTVVYDRRGELLGARIAKDGQWRFPLPDSIPGIYRDAVLVFEDRFFYYHPGFNPWSFGRALVRNIRRGEVVSGGSTISMQVIRLSRKGRARTVREKMVEVVLALRLETRYSKDEILRLYAGHAPFGGNVVGIEAAAWRYFGRDPWSLSVAEAATLAVLPNSPTLIHPGKNRGRLLLKRNRVLHLLLKYNKIDSLTYELALTEDIPDKPKDLPNEAFHLTDRFLKEKPGERVMSTVDHGLQRRLSHLMESHRERLYANQVRNAAVLILQTETGEVVAYAGNIRNEKDRSYSGDVDVIPAPRSTGSILKPILYTMMLQRGELLPDMLQADIPTRYRGYSPKNFDKNYEGVVKASEALARSLNVPAVRMLNDYGQARFLEDLRNLGFRQFDKPASHYGLSLILGGGESSLWELAGVYSSMARVLNHYTERSSKYFEEDWHGPVLELKGNKNKDFYQAGNEEGKVGAGAIWLCFESLRKVRRPESESGWEYMDGKGNVAWKTGTSFGFRDAWAIGTTREYLVAVWVGNADGEGRPGLTGTFSAAPLLFDALELLPASSWFKPPFDDLVKAEVCRQSGHRAGRHCAARDSVWISPAGLQTVVCPYHQAVVLTPDRKYRAGIECSEGKVLVTESWFVLPPAQEWYYRKKDPLYKPVPPQLPGCRTEDHIKQIQIIYPDPGSIVLVPVELSGEQGKIVFEAAHRHPAKSIFWHLDGQYTGRTQGIHQVAVSPARGKHQLVLVDEEGNEVRTVFEVR